MITTKARTKEVEEDLGPTRGLVPIFEHFELDGHLSAGIDILVLDDDELVLRCAINLDNAVERIGRVGCDEVAS